MWLFSRIKYVGKRIGNYIIEAPIGRGRYGICFLARTDKGDKVIIKKFKPGMFKRNSEKNAYEAIILSRLDDKRLPELLGVINVKDFYGFVLEYKYGDTVEDMLFNYKHVFSDEEIYNIGLKLIQIIKYLHENGVVHRDVRIPNVIVDKGEVYLIDFGLARWADDKRYFYNTDFSYIGDFLLYLIYSSFSGGKKSRKLPWYKELPISPQKKFFLKRMMGLEAEYENIDEVESSFIEAFIPQDCSKLNGGC